MKRAATDSDDENKQKRQKENGVASDSQIKDSKSGEKNELAPKTTTTTTKTTSAAAAADGDDNPLLERQTRFLSSLPPRVRDRFFSDDDVDPETRADVWARQADVGEEAVDRYAWAVPDERALRILRHFCQTRGLVEMGCGRNAYWSSLLRRRYGIDVLAYDRDAVRGGVIGRDGDDGDDATKSSGDDNEPEAPTPTTPSVVVREGGPEVLSTNKEIVESERVLLLCYPDEEDASIPIVDEEIAPNDDVAKKASISSDGDGDGNSDENDEDGNDVSLGYQCLEHFKGEYVVHVGELYGDTVSMDQAPWGRSSFSAFQERLASEFHCILKATLPNWVHVRDTISVWKRTRLCSIVFAADDDDDDNGDEPEESQYRYVPPEERLPLDAASSSCAHLLLEPDEK